MGEDSLYFNRPDNDNQAPQKTPHNGKGFPSRQSPGGAGGGHRASRAADFVPEGPA